MAKAILKHNPSLSVEQLRELLTAGFATKGYEVGKTSLIGADLYVKKNDWVGATIKLVQRNDKTFVRINGYAPSVFVRLLLYGLITMLILMPKWNALSNEVKGFLEQSLG